MCVSDVCVPGCRCVWRRPSREDKGVMSHVTGALNTGASGTPNITCNVLQYARTSIAFGATDLVAHTNEQPISLSNSLVLILQGMISRSIAQRAVSIRHSG